MYRLIISIKKFCLLSEGLTAYRCTSTQWCMYSPSLYFMKKIDFDRLKCRSRALLFTVSIERLQKYTSVWKAHDASSLPVSRQRRSEKNLTKRSDEVVEIPKFTTAQWRTCCTRDLLEFLGITRASLRIYCSHFRDRTFQAYFCRVLDFSYPQKILFSTCLNTYVDIRPIEKVTVKVAFLSHPNLDAYDYLSHFSLTDALVEPRFTRPIC